MNTKKRALWQTYERENRPLDESRGISLHFEKGVDPDVKALFMSFARWLRKTFVFPVHLNVYLLERETVLLRSGREAYGSFIWFENRPPRIRIPVRIGCAGDFAHEKYALMEEALGSFVHELTHYFQWLEYDDQSDAASEGQANYYRFRLIDRYYAETGVEPVRGE
ncbi:MAG: hypothetical protein IKI64_00565 [Clostridia bacterium]|nr:hypothetical protein [Clostridia bacterium]